MNDDGNDKGDSDDDSEGWRPEPVDCGRARPAGPVCRSPGPSAAGPPRGASWPAAAATAARN